MQTDRLKPLLLLPVVAAGALTIFPPGSWMHGSQFSQKPFSYDAPMQDMLSKSGPRSDGRTGTWKSTPQTQKLSRRLKVNEGTTVVIPQSAKSGGWLISFPSGGSASGFYGVPQRGWNVGPSGLNASVLSVPYGVGAATGFRLLLEYPVSDDSDRVVQFDVVNSSVARLPISL